MDQPKKLYRSRTDKVIAGVCGGLGEYFNMDSLIFRVIFLALLFAGGSGFWLYLILAIIIPKQPWTGQSSGPINPGEQFHDFVADVRASAQHWAAEVRGQDWQKTRDARRMWFGVIIVVIGVMALINVMFPQQWVRWSVLWPVALILIGISVLSRGGHR
ncbi:MAG: PspC domain-containing protein [Patescibacteria group bacterium]|nr:PspC domain-containing protein [Patescibacteria group bacterium]